MSVHAENNDEDVVRLAAAYLEDYRETLSLVERLHRLMMDVLKDEFERLGYLDINSVQALMLYNVSTNEVTAGELRSRGYYQGSNVSYNLKKLVESGYMDHKRCEQDRRSVRVKLTEKGLEVRKVIIDLFNRHAHGLLGQAGNKATDLGDINVTLRNIERYWSDQIRYIY